MNDTKKKILLVDDDVDFLAQQKIRFEGAGFQVFSADQEKDARALFDETNPDLVVVDLMMEQKDAGIVLSHYFKKRKPGVPIILVTGVTRETGLVFDVTTADEKSWLKADKVLSKPIRFEQLKREVDTLLS